VPRLAIAESARAEAAQALREAGVPPAARLVGFHPGARWPTRRWDSGNHAALARRMVASDARMFVLVTGAEGEEELVQAVVDGLPQGRALGLVGWPIGRLVAAQALCSAFVCGDTGPLHTAVAAGTPTLGLMSRNRPAAFFPYPESAGHRAYYARVECSPCDRNECDDLRCLHRLTVDGAWTLLSSMLRTAAGAPGTPT
jgi:heptosyltransferase-2